VSWTYSEEYYKQYTRDTWNESAPNYAPLERNLNQWNPSLLRAAAPRPGERVLDVATGTGEPALSIAPLVGASGTVLGIDLSEGMVRVATARAKEARLAQLAYRVMDAELMDLPDASFDLVVCRFGLQIVTDPDKTIAEMRRVLKPGGRLAATVWGPAERCPALHVIIGPMLEHAEPDETGYLPTPYEMGGDGELVAKLTQAGFADAREERVTREWTFTDPEAWLRATLEGSPIGHSLREEEPAVQEEVLRATKVNMQRWMGPKGVAVPSEAVVVAARKPA